MVGRAVRQTGPICHLLRCGDPGVPDAEGAGRAAIAADHRLVTSRLKLAGPEWVVPDFSTLSRRPSGLNAAIPYRPSTGALHLLIEVFCCSSLVCGRGNAPSWADQAANPRHPGPAAPFFSAADRPVLLLSFSLGQDRGLAHSGGARRRWMAARMARTIGPVTATSASWKVMARA